MVDYERIDDWEVVELLGSGDFATTYLVEAGGDQYALKLCTSGTSAARDRMQVEEDALQALDHPSIPKFVTSGSYGSQPYIVMSLAVGETLRSEIEDHALRGAVHGHIQVLQILNKLLEALAHVHRHRRVHRDVKDANIIVRPFGDNVTLIDFGFCKSIGESDLRTDDSFWRAGAARYSPPSKLENPGLAVASHDVFAVGVIGYRLLTGDYPWSVENADVGALRAAQRQVALVPVTQKSSQVPTVVSDVISRLLTLEDSRRPTAEDAITEVLSALEKLQDRQALGVRISLRPPLPHIIRDCLYGDIRLSDYEYRVLSTPQMQRLRGVKQLGFTRLVYPGAEHTRFHHAIGCLNRVEQMLRTIEDIEGTRIDESVRLHARLYGLTHDVTHIPFGHTVEDELGFFVRHDENVERYHRLTDAGTSMGDVLRENDVGRSALEHLNPESASHENSVVAELISGIMGADVLDYIDRDAYFCGLDNRIDSAIFRQFRLRSLPAGSDPRFVSVIAGRYGIRIDREYAIETILAERYAMFLKVYTHSAKNAASTLLAKALTEALSPRRGKNRLREENIEQHGDETLIYLLRNSSKELVKKCAEDIHWRRLPRGVYRAVLLSQDERDEHGHRDGQEWMVRAGLGDPKTRTETEARIAKEAKLEPHQVLIHCPPKAPGFQRAEHWTTGRSGVAKPAQSSAGAGITRKHLGLWELWVYVSNEVTDPAVQNTVADTAQLIFGKQNLIDIDARTDRLL